MSSFLTEKKKSSAPRREHRPGSLDISSTIAAFSEDQVEGITRLSKARLRYWARTGFFQPSFVEENASLPFSRFYSFKEVVALRTLETLRVQNNVPLQHLRKVAERLAHLENEIWTATTLCVVDRKVVFDCPDTGTPREVVTGQYLLGVPLAKMIEDTTAEIVQLRSRKSETVGRVARTRGVMRNALVVAGTRVPVASVRRLSEDGYSPAQIVEEYPELSIVDVEAALSSGIATAA